MKLIVGFGNPGREYLWTRHNFGHISLDFYAKLHKLEWGNSIKYKADILKTKDAIFMKSHLFYNEVGLPVRRIVDFYKIKPSDILVICDDFNIPFGTTRLRAKGSDGGNNGLKSMITHLGTSDFARLRLGTDAARRETIGDSDFVLSKFTTAEKSDMPAVLRKVSDVITDFID